MPSPPPRTTSRGPTFSGLAAFSDDGNWRSLTAMRSKYDLYLMETYPRESWSSGWEIIDSRLVATLQRVAILTIKPDGIVGRKAAACLEFMARNGYVPLFARRFAYTRHITRELWRYQWNVASIDRLAVSTLLNSLTDAVMIFFVDDTKDAQLPASVRLTGLKGSNVPAERSDRHLRCVLGGVNRIITYVHCADEPIDIVREIGIVFPADEVEQIYRDIDHALKNGGSPESVETVLSGVHDAHPRRILDLDPAIERFEELAGRPLARSHHVRDALFRAQAAVRGARMSEVPLSWRSWIADCRGAGLDPDPWTEFVIGAHLIDGDRPEDWCILANGSSDWRQGNGRRVF